MDGVIIMTTKIDSRIEEVLSFDPVASVSKVLNKHHNDFSTDEQDLSLSYGILANRSKSDFLKSLNDTHFGMSWNYFIELIQENGFQEGLSYEFDYAFDLESTKPEDWSREKAVLFYHPTKGLVIWATSYNNQTSVNGGKMYGEVRYTGTIETKEVPSLFKKGMSKAVVMTDEIREAMKTLDRCQHDSITSTGDGISFWYDIREGLINKMTLIESKLEYVRIWTKKPFLWFVDYLEEKNPDYDSEFMSLDKINRSNEELQTILKVCKEELITSLTKRGFLD